MPRRCWEGTLGQFTDARIREAGPLRLEEEVVADRARGEGLFEPDEPVQPQDEPGCIAGGSADLGRRRAVAQRLHRGKEASVVRLMQEIGAPPQLSGRGKPLFQGPNRLAQGGLKGALDCHHFAGRFHLRAQGTIGRRELVEGPARNLDDAIIEGRLEGRRRLAGDGVGNLVQQPTHRNLGRDAGNRIAGRLRGQRRGATDPRIDLDHKVLV